MHITKDQVDRAVSAYRNVSIEQALWSVFGEVNIEDAKFARENFKMEDEMRNLLERVAELRAARMPDDGTGPLAEEISRMYKKRTGRLTDYSPKEQAAWRDVVRMVLDKAKVSL